MKLETEVDEKIYINVHLLAFPELLTTSGGLNHWKLYKYDCAIALCFSLILKNNTVKKFFIV